MSSLHPKFAGLTVCLAVLLSSFAISETASGGKPPKDPLFFDLVYCWGTVNPADIGPWCPCVEQTLFPDKTFDAFDCLTGQTTTDAGTWKLTRNGRNISFTLFNGTRYDGEQQPDGSFLGTMVSNAPGSEGLMGIWQGSFVP